MSTIDLLASVVASRLDPMLAKVGPSGLWDQWSSKVGANGAVVVAVVFTASVNVCVCAPCGLDVAFAYDTGCHPFQRVFYLNCANLANFAVGKCGPVLHAPSGNRNTYTSTPTKRPDSHTCFSRATASSSVAVRDFSPITSIPASISAFAIG